MNVGANNVFSVPVAVYVGSKLICEGENDGIKEIGGNANDGDGCAEEASPVALAAYDPSKIEEEASTEAQWPIASRGSSGIQPFSRPRR